MGTRVTTDRSDAKVAPATVEDTRDAAAVAKRAQEDWAVWQPGDGSRYAVRLVRIAAGPDRADLVLLVSIHGDTAAFQFPTAAYRRAQAQPWTRQRARDYGHDWAWLAAKPLLEHFRATVDGRTDADLTTEARAAADGGE